MPAIRDRSVVRILLTAQSAVAWKIAVVRVYAADGEFNTRFHVPRKAGEVPLEPAHLAGRSDHRCRHRRRHGVGGQNKPEIPARSIYCSIKGRNGGEKCKGEDDEIRPRASQ
jgi:hypothetical protein